jgi:hypothetical protein
VPQSVILPDARRQDKSLPIRALDCAQFDQGDRRSADQAANLPNGPTNLGNYILDSLGGLGSINHSAHEFARGDVTTNGIESFNALLKRGILGVYHHVTPKHLPRYVNEFSFRLNEGNVRNHTIQRLDSLVRRSAGKRLTLEALTNA